MASLATHLAVKGRAACGVPYHPLVSTLPGEVNCLRCKRTIHMADAEARLAIQPNKKRTRRKEAR